MGLHAGEEGGLGEEPLTGLIPRARGLTDPALARALAERDRSMERRAVELAEHAIDRHHVWVERLGRPPANWAVRQQWMRAVSTVAAYRDRWGIGNDHQPLGPETVVKSIEGLGHRKGAQAAVEAALRIAGQTHTAQHETPALVPEREIEL